MEKSILLIDDDRLVLRSLARLLEKEGYNVICAESGQQAVDLSDHTNFDLIISDIKMPGLNGIQTTYNIKNIFKEKDKKMVPVIFITGYADETSCNEAKNLNINDFIYKPFGKDKFLEAIKKALRSV